MSTWNLIAVVLTLSGAAVSFYCMRVAEKKFRRTVALNAEGMRRIDAIVATEKNWNETAMAEAAKLRAELVEAYQTIERLTAELAIARGEPKSEGECPVN